ncbi:hypothetical protein Tco_0624004 [Tanacetum coccineum]|uniref:Uncharacterized protein n=1 Tax=Tanacetum coccineum TaxID=301880 RepID=A0ABQ4WCL9_9ASTR
MVICRRLFGDGYLDQMLILTFADGYLDQIERMRWVLGGVWVSASFSSMRVFPQCDFDGLLVPTPKKVLDTKMVKNGYKLGLFVKYCFQSFIRFKWYITMDSVYKWLEENIESVIGINKDDIDEEDDESSTMEPPSRNEAIKAAITLNNFLLSYEKTTPEVLTMLRKIRDEIQGEIDFNKKQKTIESFFKKPS